MPSHGIKLLMCYMLPAPDHLQGFDRSHTGRNIRIFSNHFHNSRVPAAKIALDKLLICAVYLLFISYLYPSAGFVIAFALSLLVLGALVTFGFTAFIRTIIDHQVALRVGGQSFGWWSRPPVEPIIRIFVYNVTNADEFLNNGTKPILDELGPYVYV